MSMDMVQGPGRVQDTENMQEPGRVQEPERPEGVRS